MNKLIPVTGIVPTANRHEVLRRTLESIAKQECQPEEIIVVDASETDHTATICKTPVIGLMSVIKYQKAKQKGAAIQRNEGLNGMERPYIFFLMMIFF